MKKIFLIMGMGYILIAQNNKINIAVLDLDATNINIEDARFLSDRLRVELFDAGRFNVLERDKMNVILEEQGFQMSGCTSLECAVEIGQLLNVQQMVAGSIGRIGNVYSITLRLINVQTGELMQTAKHDYQGELSEMLTEVLPEIASELSVSERQPQANVKKSEGKNSHRWGIQLKFGTMVSTVITDFNNSINEFNATFQPDIDEMSQFRSFSLTAVWDYNEDWRYNFGIQLSGMTDDWKYKLEDYTDMNSVTYDRLEFERSLSFVYIYADVDYKISLLKDIYLYLGTGLGLNSMTSNVKQQYEPQSNEDSAEDDSYNYVVLAIRLKAGFDFIVTENLTLFLEFSPVIQTEYDTADEYPAEDAYLDFKDVLYPETINGTAVVGSVGITYFF